MTNNQVPRERPTTPESIKRWLHRLLEEKTLDLKKLAEDISALNHQAENFESMRPEVQEQVINAINQQFETYGWECRIVQAVSNDE